MPVTYIVGSEELDIKNTGTEVDLLISEEVTVEAKSTHRIDIDFRSRLVDFAEYNLQVTCSSGIEGLGIETSWFVSGGTEHVRVREEVEFSRFPFGTTKRNSPVTNEVKRILIENKSDEDKIVKVDFTTYQSTSIRPNEMNGIDPNPPSVDVNTQYLTNQKLFNLKTNDVSLPAQVDESKPCLVQSLIIKGNHRHRDISIRLKSLEDDTSNYIGSALYNSRLRFFYLNDLGGEDAFFKLTKYEEESGNEGDYILILKQPFYCPNGFTIELKEGNEFENEEMVAEISVVYFNGVE